MDGSFNLHLASRRLPLDFFVCYSSAASLLGSAGQAGYAAANAFQDALARYRRATGAPGLSVDWGAWAGAGMATRLTAPQRRQLAERGFGEIQPAEALRVLGDLIAEGVAQAAILPVDWEKFLAQLAGDGVPPFLEEVARRDGARRPEGAVGIQARASEAPPERRRDVLTDYVRMQVAKVLGTYSAGAVDPQKGFWSMGMDSLLSLELRNRLQTDLDRRLSATLTMDYPNVDALVEHLGRMLGLFGTGASTAEPAVPTQARAPRRLGAHDVFSLTESEAEARLLDRLEEMEY
jgi:acyl carrier protein